MGNGKYKPTLALSPAGENVKYYINPDKNGATVRKEVLSKQLKEYIQTLLPDGIYAFARKESGSVAVLRKELCAIVVESQHKTGIAWNYPLAAKCHLDTNAIGDHFLESSGQLSYP